MNFFGEQFATSCAIGHICIECFCFVFFYEKHIRDFLKRREKIVSRTSLPNMGRGGEHIVYDNECNLASWSVWANHALNRFERDEQFRITRVMRDAVPIPAVASASVLQSAAVGGSVVGVVGSL